MGSNGINPPFKGISVPDRAILAAQGAYIGRETRRPHPFLWISRIEGACLLANNYPHLVYFS
jgi:hypothetical protein